MHSCLSQSLTPTAHALNCKIREGGTLSTLCPGGTLGSRAGLACSSSSCVSDGQGYMLTPWDTAHLVLRWGLSTWRWAFGQRHLYPKLITAQAAPTPSPEAILSPPSLSIPWTVSAPHLAGPAVLDGHFTRAGPASILSPDYRCSVFLEPAHLLL